VSSRGVEIVRAAFAAWSAGRVEEFAGMLDPDLTWDIAAHPLPDFPDRGSGREPFLGHLAGYAAGWVDYEVSQADVIDAGDEVIDVLHERAAMRGTDVVLDRELVVVWTVAGDLLTRFRVFRTRAEALAALGA
jgi:ketosteroid isomerase-like protein